MKRALITGGAGFIAHHLVSQILKNTDWEVVTLDRLDFSGNLNRLQDVLKDFPAEERARVKVVFHDLKAAVNPLIAADIGKVDYILHLAAGSHVDRSGPVDRRLAGPAAISPRSVLPSRRQPMPRAVKKASSAT